MVAICDEWYGDRLGGSVRRSAFGGPLAVKSLLYGKEVTLVATPHHRSLIALLAMETLLGRRRIVLLEFIRRAPRNRLEVIHERVLGWLMRRTVRSIHVLSMFEKKEYGDRYGIDQSVFRFIPWPMLEEDDDDTRSTVALTFPEARDVVATGRASCDWQTLAEAQRLGGWSLTVICSDRKSVV